MSLCSDTDKFLMSLSPMHRKMEMWSHSKVHAWRGTPGECEQKPERGLRKHRKMLQDADDALCKSTAGKPRPLQASREEANSVLRWL